MKKFYTKFTNGGQSWRTSVSNAIFKRNNQDKDSITSSSDNEEDSFEEDAKPIEGLMFRSVPDGESFTKDSDSSDIYCIPDTSINHTEEQPYQNIVDMTEELEKLKKTKFTVTERQLSDCYDDKNDSDATDKFFECEVSSSERSSLERDIVSNKTDEDSFGDNYSTNFNEGYSSRTETTPPKLQPKKLHKSFASIPQSEYDIPRITFSFLDPALNNPQPENNYEVLNAKPILKLETDEKKKTCKSEIRIILNTPKIDTPPQRITNDNNFQKCKSHDNITLLQNKCQKKKAGVGLKLTKSISDFSKYLNGKGHTDQASLLEDSMNKQPPEQIYASIKKKDKRTSLSLGNLKNVEPLYCSTPLKSLENIEIIRVDDADKNFQPKSKSTDELDYCTTRENLPAKMRRATLVKRTFIKSRAEHTWSNFRTRLNNIITTQAAAQRIGAQNETATSFVEEYPKASKSVDKMYKKTKHNLSKINEKIFDRKGTRRKLYDESELKFESESEPAGGSESVKSSVGQKPEVSDSEKGGECNSMKSAFRKSKYLVEGQNGFDDLRRYIKQGGDFCKELSTILQERSEAELQYAKSLSKLSAKLNRACRESVGTINDAWKHVSIDMETRAEVHRQFSSQLCEDIVKPLRHLTESQHKTRKNTETHVDKAARTLTDWRAAEAKSKKLSHASARENEKLQDALLDVRLSRSNSLIHLSHLNPHKATSDKETAKLEVKKRKAEEAVKKSDIEYYTLCVRAERARLEWESGVLRGSTTFQALEEERLKNLKSYLSSYLHLCNEMEPRILESTESLKIPIIQCDPAKDSNTFTSLRNSSQHVAEQLLPDFYCEHITLAMNRERRKQALVKLLQLIRQDLERERKSKHGLENLSRAIKQTPNFGTDDSQQNVSEKMYHIRSMLTYLEGARYKVQNALAEIDNRQRLSHPLASHITVTRDKSGLQQSILKVPPWIREEAVKALTGNPAILACEPHESTDIVSDWIDRGMGDGNSNQPDSDFDEFSSQSSGESIKQEVLKNDEIREASPIDEDGTDTTPICHCRALYQYAARLPDELSLYPGDVLSVYRQQADGWWLGECAGAVGIFPATYVEQIAST